MAYALNQNPALRSLNLGANCISGKGALAISESLAGNTFLVSLNTTNNWDTNAAGWTKIEKAVKCNGRVLRVLNDPSQGEEPQLIHPFRGLYVL